MQIKIYLLFILSNIFLPITTKAQELFPKKELYHIWILADEKLDAGLFDDASRLYSTHTENPSFSMKIRQISRLKEITVEADKLKRKGHYADAIDKYKEYRKLKDMPTLGIFEKKIEACLTQINKASLNELTSQQRVITGFEFAHRGREKLSKMDTTGARRDFNNAKNLGGNRNNILKDQYTDGILATSELVKWAKNYTLLKASAKSKTQELAILESYREIRNLDIPEIELKIKELRTEIDGNNSLSAVAKLCDTKLLLSYINSNKKSTQVSALFQSRLNEFISTQKKIELLRLNVANAETVKSAYASLISWSDEFPDEIREDVRLCIENDYKTYVTSLPVEIATMCSGKDDFFKGVVLVRQDLANCNLSRAKALWKKNIVNLRDCSEAKVILDETQALRDSINLAIKNDSLLTIYHGQLQQFSQNGDCSKSLKVYEQMKGLRVCNQEALDEQIKTGISEAKNCHKNSWFRPELIAGVARNFPKYTISDLSKKMNSGWTGSAGIQLSFIDHKNPIDFIIGVEYVEANYSVLGSQGSVLEDFTLSGANAIVSIKLHQTNTNPNHIRPYLKFGTEIFVPTAYKYDNYSNFTAVSSTEEIQKTILSLTGGLGLEIQKQHFGAFIEGFGNFGTGNIYTSSVSHLTSAPNQKVDARMTRVGLRIGFRIW